MKSLWIAIILCLTTFAFAAEPERPASDSNRHNLDSTDNNAAIVDAQLKAYNKHDLEELLTFFHPEIESYKFPGEPQLNGKEALHKAFGDQFKHQPNEVVVERIVENNYVIDSVEVTYKVEGSTMTHRGVVIYTIEDGLIRRLMFL